MEHASATFLGSSLVSLWKFGVCHGYGCLGFLAAAEGPQGDPTILPGDLLGSAEDPRLVREPSDGWGEMWIDGWSKKMGAVGIGLVGFCCCSEEFFHFLVILKRLS